MIPIIFDANTQDYTSNGIGRLTDCISCLVTEERNGIYEVEFTYPITGIHYDAIQQGNIIVVSHDEQKDKQPFIIYRISRPINGVVIVNCHHISYLLRNIVVAPFTAVNVSDAMNSLSVCSITENTFTFWTDKSSAGSMEVKVPTSCRAILGGTKGSILDSFGGGEYEFDNMTVKLYAHRGANNGVTIRYGKNLTDIKAEEDTLDLYNAVVPYYANDETVVYGGIVVGSGGIGRSGVWTDENNSHITDENNADITFGFTVRRVVTMDLSSEFDNPPTVVELESRALTIMNSNTPWIPKESIKIDFVALWQTEEYKNIAPLERVKLCDTVTVEYTDLGVNATAKVIKVVWDALLERYDSIELGDARTSFADVITAETDEKLADIPNTSMMDAAIEKATSLITGGMGGHIVFLYDADGKPTDMLIMDTDDVNTAVHVLRFNVNGIGFSSTGVSGTYTSAWTLDGAFVADFITAGHLSANRIQGGTLTLGGLDNINGVVVVYDSNGDQIGRWDRNGLSASGEFTLTRKLVPSGLQMMYGALAHFAYYSYSLVEGKVYESQGDGFQIERTRNGEIVGQKCDILTNSGEVIEYTYAKEDWAKRIYIGNPNGNGHYLLYEYGNLGYSVSAYKCGTPSTAWPLFSEDLRNGTLDIWDGLIRIGKSGTSTARIFLNGSANSSTEGNNCYFSMSSDGTYHRFEAHMNNNAYMEYNTSNWVIKGANQNGSIAVQGSSSKRYKHDITDQIDDNLDPHKLYELPMKQFVFNSDHPLQYADMDGQTLPGFIAEDVAEIYPSAVIRDEKGQIENWDERRIIPGMLKLIQEQHDEIECLKARLEKLETIVEQLMR